MNEIGVLELMVEKEQLGFWLCQLENGKLALVVDHYDVNADWLHLLIVTEQDVPRILCHNGDGCSLSDSLIPKYPFDRIISRRAFRDGKKIEYYF